MKKEKFVKDERTIAIENQISKISLYAVLTILILSTVIKAIFFRETQSFLTEFVAFIAIIFVEAIGNAKKGNFEMSSKKFLRRIPLCLFLCVAIASLVTVFTYQKNQSSFSDIWIPLLISAIFTVSFASILLFLVYAYTRHKEAKSEKEE